MQIKTPTPEILSLKGSFIKLIQKQKKINEKKLKLPAMRAYLNAIQKAVQLGVDGQISPMHSHKLLEGLRKFLAEVNGPLWQDRFIAFQSMKIAKIDISSNPLYQSIEILIDVTSRPEEHAETRYKMIAMLGSVHCNVDPAIPDIFDEALLEKWHLLDGSTDELGFLEEKISDVKDKTLVRKEGRM